MSHRLVLPALLLGLLHACGSGQDDPCPGACGAGLECCPACPCATGTCSPEGVCVEGCSPKTLTGDITITSDDDRLSDLEGATVIEGSLHLSGLTRTDLAPLECLEEVRGGLHVGFLESLETISALNRLVRVDDGLGIYHCYALHHLDGLESLTTLGGNLDISFNSSLPLCEVEAFVARLRENGFTGNAETSFNDETATCDE
ncbi:MAG: hypothetical protein JXR96_27080 [Deltaproteobacteria bacterium]|nr:hypothetical protein [Deltaproteobacteria bacterium]